MGKFLLEVNDSNIKIALMKNKGLKYSGWGIYKNGRGAKYSWNDSRQMFVPILSKTLPKGISKAPIKKNTVGPHKGGNSQSKPSPKSFSKDSGKEIPKGKTKLVVINGEIKHVPIDSKIPYKTSQKPIKKEISEKDKVVNNLKTKIDIKSFVNKKIEKINAKIQKDVKKEKVNKSLEKLKSKNDVLKGKLDTVGSSKKELKKTLEDFINSKVEKLKEKHSKEIKSIKVKHNKSLEKLAKKIDKKDVVKKAPVEKEPKEKEVKMKQLNDEEKDFQKVVDFYEKNKRIPREYKEGVSDKDFSVGGVVDWDEWPMRKLLQDLRDDKSKADMVRHLDKHGLLDLDKHDSIDERKMLINGKMTTMSKRSDSSKVVTKEEVKPKFVNNDGPKIVLSKGQSFKDIEKVEKPKYGNENDNILKFKPKEDIYYDELDRLRWDCSCGGKDNDLKGCKKCGKETPEKVFNVMWDRQEKEFGAKKVNK